MAIFNAVIGLVAMSVHNGLSDTAKCKTAADCKLNGDCIDGSCACDPQWSGSPDCAVMKFVAVDKNNRPGYYNKTEATWGGLPVEGADGKWHLIHAQMANHCGLGEWTTASVIARAVAETALGPYTWAEQLIPPFAHNPTIRKTPTGEWVIWFIGGWPDVGPPPNCSHPSESWDAFDAIPRRTTALARAETQSNCSVTYDPPSEIRVGSDAKTVQLDPNATIKDCGASCCADPNCLAFSFNTFASGAPPICKHKDNAVRPQKGNGCPIVRGQPNCMSGGIQGREVCNGQTWPKSCGPNMPGPNGDCCGPCGTSYNANCGCGIAMATSEDLTHGTWNVSHLHILDQFTSDDVYCTHTNPSPFLLPNGSIVMAFNAGFCNNHLETIGLAVSHGGWQGPWNLLVRNSILKNPDGSPHHCEDPFIWKSSRGWHLLVHNQQKPQGESAYAFSEDGFSWTLSPTTPYDCTLHFTDGTTAEASGCGNRPQIVFDNKGEAQFIVNGAFGAKPNGWPGTYTLFRPLAQKHQSG